jgi:hypothetical protein
MAQQSTAVKAFVQCVNRHYVVAYKPNQNNAVQLYKDCCSKIQNFGARLLRDPLGSDALVKQAIAQTAPHLSFRDNGKASSKPSSAGSVSKGAGKSAQSASNRVGKGGKSTENANGSVRSSLQTERRCPCCHQTNYATVR